MKYIDLTQPLIDGMPVYPGDPEVSVKEIHTLGKEGWNLHLLSFSTHIGTHVNVPYHMDQTGRRLDAYFLASFIGTTKIFSPQINYSSKVGLLFTKYNITEEITNQLILKPPKFIALSEKFDFAVELEKRLLKKGIISFENIANTNNLPESFTFYGIPLHLPGSDGSPVRAFAEIKN